MYKWKIGVLVNNVGILGPGLLWFFDDLLSVIIDHTDNIYILFDHGDDDVR